MQCYGSLNVYTCFESPGINMNTAVEKRSVHLHAQTTMDRFLVQPSYQSSLMSTVVLKLCVLFIKSHSDQVMPLLCSSYTVPNQYYIGQAFHSFLDSSRRNFGLIL